MATHGKIQASRLAQSTRAAQGAPSTSEIDPQTPGLSVWLDRLEAAVELLWSDLGGLELKMKPLTRTSIRTPPESKNEAGDNSEIVMRLRGSITKVDYLARVVNALTEAYQG